LASKERGGGGGRSIEFKKQHHHKIRGGRKKKNALAFLQPRAEKKNEDLPRRLLRLWLHEDPQKGGKEKFKNLRKSPRPGLGGGEGEGT